LLNKLAAFKKLCVFLRYFFRLFPEICDHSMLIQQQLQIEAIVRGAGSALQKANFLVTLKKT
jgi:hypothetical protein